MTCLGSRKSNFNARRRRNRIGSANELYCESRKRLFAEKRPHNLEFIAEGIGQLLEAAATGKPAFDLMIARTDLWAVS